MGCCDSTPAVAPSEIAEGRVTEPEGRVTEPLMRPLSVEIDGDDSCQKASIGAVMTAAFGANIMDEAAVGADKGLSSEMSCKPSAGTSFTPRLLSSVTLPPPAASRSTHTVAPAAASNACKSRCGSQDLWDSSGTARPTDVGATTPARGAASRPTRVAPELVRLQYREVTPEDYDLLSLLDDAVPKRGTTAENIIASLPIVQAPVKADDSNADTCHICLSEMQTHASVVQLPCQHSFHPECISRWLTQYKGTCPVCKAPVVPGSVESMIELQDVL